MSLRGGAPFCFCLTLLPVSVPRVHATSAMTARVLENIRRKKAEDRQERVASVLQLKASTDEAFARLRGANERKARRRAALQEARKKEFDELVQQGKNPYKARNSVRSGHTPRPDP